MTKETNMREMADLDRKIADARTAWHEDIYAAADWPDPRYKPEAEAKQHKFLTDSDSFEICRFLFHFEAAKISTASSMKSFLLAHNESLQESIKDTEFETRTRIKTERLKDALLKDSSINNSCMMVAFYEKPVINGVTLASLMSRICGKSKIDDCLRVFETAKLIQVEDTAANNTRVIVNWEKLNKAFLTYLCRIKKMNS